VGARPKRSRKPNQKKHRLASRCPSRESLLLVEFSIALKEEIIAL
jgi:hypothetical protein